MRLLHCIPNMGGGGAERQLCYLAQGLVQRGHDVHVAILSNEGPNRAHLASTGARIHELGVYSTFDPRLVVALARLARRLRAEVMQTWLRRMDVTAGAAALALRIPFIYSERLRWDGQGWRDRVRLGLIDHAAAIVTNSANASTFWNQRYGGQKPVFFVPNAISATAIAAAGRAPRAAFELDDEDEVVLFVGRFSAQKNIALLADTMIALFGQRPHARALLCGIGEETALFTERLKAAGLWSRCRLVGYREDVWSLMKTADVLISTSFYEGQPNSVLEGMAAGCPLVLSDIAEHREVVDEASAIFFPLGDAARAAAAVAKALDDRDEAATRARAARARIAEFSIEAAARRYESIYADLVR